MKGDGCPNSPILHDVIDGRPLTHFYRIMCHSHFLATHLSNQCYNICFRRNYRTCAICFSPTVIVAISAAINQVQKSALSTIIKTWYCCGKVSCLITIQKQHVLFPAQFCCICKIPIFVVVIHAVDVDVLTVALVMAKVLVFIG